jgi:hypothetical protein
VNEQDQMWLKELAAQIETDWIRDYKERGCEAAHRRMPRFRREYLVTEFLDSASDRDVYREMGVPGRYVRSDISPLNDGIREWLRNIQYIHNPTWERHDAQPDLFGIGLILWGPPSSGKTVTACALLLAMVRMGIHNTDPTLRNLDEHGASMGRFVSWQDASELFRQAASGDEEMQEAAEDLKKAMRGHGTNLDAGNFLLIDDISRERGTEFNKGELQRVLRYRHEQGLATILTTNHSPDEWAEYYGDVFAGFLRRAFFGVEFEAQPAVTIRRR